MITLLSPRLLSLALLAPLPALLPLAQPLTSLDRVALHASADPSLGALRAGRADAPAAVAASERSALARAERSSPSLGALRAGFEPTNNEWTWLAIGAGIVLLAVIL